MLFSTSTLLLLTLFSQPSASHSPSIIRPDAPLMRLDDLGLYDVGYSYQGQPDHFFPTGWSGDFDDKTGVACRPSGEQGGRPAFLLHPPWRGGRGIAFQQFTFALPATPTRITLKGASALGADAAEPGKSDGVTFRLFVDGKPLLDTHRETDDWQPFSFDLTPQAGQTITLRFETDPGPRDNSSFDFALWADRELVLEGYTPAPISWPQPPPLPLATLATPAPSVVPPVASKPRLSITQDKDAFLLTSTAPDGILTYRWQLPDQPADPLLGRLELSAHMTGAQPVKLPLAGSAALDWATPPASPVPTARWAADGTPTLVREFNVNGQPAAFKASASLVNKSLVLDISCDAPHIASFDPGAWGPTLRRKNVPVPFYSGQVHFLPSENLFVNSFLDWTQSAATSHQGTRARYEARTDGTRHTLAERVVFSPSWYLPEVFPGIPNPASPFKQAVAGRLVLDIWGGRFDHIERDLETLADHGVSNAIALIHDWQRDGYDNALPAHYPAAADKGGEPAMKSLIAKGKQLGLLMALHENYVDYYPNYEHFNEREIALDRQGDRQKAWFNSGTGIQSFAVAPDAILRLASQQSPFIQQRYDTNSSFLDVHSAVPPWFHADQRASAEGAGRFGYVFDTHARLWSFERQNHGGPVFGEGNNHWYWSGLLDGAEAQYGSGWPTNQGRAAPLAVDFDLLRLHALQVNHGMGYHSRWWSDADDEAWGSHPPMTALDQYRLQTLSYGHAPFVNRLWNQMPWPWLEHHLAVPVATRFALASPQRIDYLLDDGQWVDATTAARKSADFSRVRIQYDNGLTFIANQADKPLEVEGHTLPRFGWLATAPSFIAGTTLRQGIVTDFVDEDTHFFANARPALDWNTSGLRRILPQVAAFESPAPRQLRFSYNWQVDDTLDRDYTAFVHFGLPGTGQQKGEILFQQDHRPAAPTSTWKPGTNVTDGPFTLALPQNLPDGSYHWTIGLYAPEGGPRPTLLGTPDRSGRIVLGTLVVAQEGRQIRFESAPEASEDRLKIHLENLNTENRLIDFGPIQTDGSVALTREGADWVLRPWPRDRSFTIRLEAARFPTPPTITCPGGSTDTISPRPTGDFWTLPINGARLYRWPAS